MVEPRDGMLRHWDEFTGPGAGAAETAGTLASAAAGAVLAPRLARGRPGRGAAAVLSVLALDLWGGAWCNNTAACARWYERPGQGTREHLVFSLAHLHPFAVAALDARAGVPGAWRAAALRYAYLQGATLAVRACTGRARRVAGVAATAAGVALDASLGRSRSAPWFGPVFFAKLLAGHAAGAALTPR
ncbi:hypothetical protein [Kineococcus sp. NUM-3379]